MVRITEELEDGRIWVVRAGRVVTVGVTDRVISEIGSLESVELVGEGEKIDESTPLATLNGESGSYEVMGHFEGIVLEVNDGLVDHPENVEQDPLDEGWLVRIQLA